MVKIQDVAERAGTSISTVSKALNGSYTISPETTARIKSIADEMGYRPNARAQTFARKSTRSVVFLAKLGKDTAFESPHLFEILTGAEAALREKKYALSLQNCTAKNVCTHAHDIKMSKSADGLLIHASVVTRELALLLTREEIPHIIIGKPDFTSSLCWIDNDNRLSGTLAAKRLKSLGHKKIAVLAGHEDDQISEYRLEGIQSELAHSTHIQIYRGASTIEDGAQMAHALLTAPRRATAVICANNFLAVGCLRAFRQNNIRVPDDISLITFDEYPFAKFTDPPLTTISIDVFDLGTQAGKLLVSKIKKPGFHVQSHSTLPVLVARASDAMINMT
ncbi:MAG: LacI family transcriptional regulator [Defluviitaleaceae bacterium]|nr:LacI family transcriptional regulator [Defluviitaleaceae bacterium]